MPYLNQFLSPDPIIPDYFNPQSLNKYSYVLNNPVNLIDPSGLVPPLPVRWPPGTTIDDLDAFEGLGAKWEAWRESVLLNRLKPQILQTAHRLNNRNLTNMNPEAFAAMIGAKIIMEDAYLTRDPFGRIGSFLPSNYPRPIIDWLKDFSLFGFSPYKGEISFGIANIPPELADKILEASNTVGQGIDFRPNTPLPPWAGFGPNLTQELETERGAIEFTGAAILYGAYQAQTLNGSQSIITYKCRQVYPRLPEEVSAYVIASGVIHHGAAVSPTEVDYHSVYNPARWTARGSQGVWTDAIPDAARIMGITGLDYLAYMSYEREVLPDAESEKHPPVGGRIGQ